jgi:hypothetical protein
MRFRGTERRAATVRSGVAAAAVLAVIASGCGGDTPSRSASASTTTPQPPPGNRFEDFNPANFDASSINIDNRYFPLRPGRQYTYKGTTVEEGKTVPHEVVFAVTNLVKELNGVRTVVIWDRDYKDNTLEESELTFFAQDKSGNVWHLGQYREEYDNEGKELRGAQAWLVGYLEGARAGIFMHPDPKAGTPSYSEGYAPPPYYWTDRAYVDQVGVKTTVPAGNYDDVIVTAEYSETEPDAYQLKYYAPGLGVVRVGYRGNDTTREKLELTESKELPPDELTKVSTDALQLETRANIYGKTPAAQLRSGA